MSRKTFAVSAALFTDYATNKRKLTCVCSELELRSFKEAFCERFPCTLVRVKPEDWKSGKHWSPENLYFVDRESFQLCPQGSSSNVLPIPVIKYFLDTGRVVEWNYTWVDTCRMSGQSFALLGATREEIQRYTRSVRSQNGLVSNALIPSTTHVIIFQSDFTNDIEQFEQFLVASMANQIKIWTRQELEIVMSGRGKPLIVHRPLHQLQFNCSENKQIENIIVSLGGTIVNNLSTCTILLLNTETTEDHFQQAKNQQLIVLDETWLGIIADKKRRRPFPNSQPPEISNKFSNINIRIATKNEYTETVQRVFRRCVYEDEGAILTSGDCRSPTRDYVGCAVKERNSSHRTLFCAIQVLERNHDNVCSGTHFPISKKLTEIPEDIEPLLVCVRDNNTRRFLISALKLTSRGLDVTVLNADIKIEDYDDRPSVIWDGEENPHVMRSLSEVFRGMVVFSASKILAKNLKLGYVKLSECTFDDWLLCLPAVVRRDTGTSSDGVLEVNLAQGLSVSPSEFVSNHGKRKRGSEEDNEAVKNGILCRTHQEVPRITSLVQMTMELEFLLYTEFHKHPQFVRCFDEDVSVYTRSGAESSDQIYYYIKQTGEGDNFMTVAMPILNQKSPKAANIRDECILLGILTKVFERLGLKLVGVNDECGNVLFCHTGKSIDHVVAKFRKVRGMEADGTVYSFMQFVMSHSILGIIRDMIYQSPLLFRPTVAYVNIPESEHFHHEEGYLTFGMTTKKPSTSSPFILVEKDATGTVIINYSASLNKLYIGQQIGNLFQRIVDSHEECVQKSTKEPNFACPHHAGKSNLALHYFFKTRKCHECSRSATHVICDKFFQ